MLHLGEVPEWLNGADSKSVVRVSVPWVRIPPSPYLSLHEKIVPTLGVVMVNTKVMRSNGVPFGIDTNDGSPIQFGIGALGEIV